MQRTTTSPDSSDPHGGLRTWVASHSSALALIAAGMFLIIAFGIAAYQESRSLRPTDDSDETAYFSQACRIAEHGGIIGFLKECFLGTYPHDNRHPLVPLAVSPWARRSLDAVRPMRAAKVVLAAIALIIVFLVAGRVVPLPGALALVALLAMSQNWYMKARVVCTEPLVYALFFLAWALISGVWRPRGRWFWAGAAAGLTWLAKGTGVLLLLALFVAFIVHVAVRARKGERVSGKLAQARVAAAAGLFLAGFILCAMPLLWRNTVRFGNPLHNKNTALMWADDDHAQLMTDEQRAEHPLTPWSYLKRHSLADIGARLAGGVVKQAPRLLGGFAPDRSFGRALWVGALVVSSVLVLLGLIAVATQLRTWAGTYTAVLLGVSFLLFAWHSPITYASRFAATLVPICGLQAFSIGIPKLRAGADRLKRWLTPASVVLALGVGVLLLCRTQLNQQKSAWDQVPTSPEYRFLLKWFRQEVVGTGAVCFETPYLAPRYRVHWLLGKTQTIHDVPPADSFQELDRHMASLGARFLIVERDSLRDREKLFADYFGHDAQGNLRVRAVPPGWTIHVKDREGALDFVILKRARSAETPQRGG